MKHDLANFVVLAPDFMGFAASAGISRFFENVPLLLFSRALGDRLGGIEVDGLEVAGSQLFGA